MKTVLFLVWKSFGNEFIIEELEKRGFEIDFFDFPKDTENTRNSIDLTEAIARRVLQTRPDFVFSFNYYPVAAIACKACRTKYVSWVYDSPYILLYSQTVLYDTNRVFLFDSHEVEKLRGLGAEHVYYMPMGSAVEYYDTLEPTPEMHQMYDSDVTFIGSMYSEQRQYLYHHLENVDEYTKGYLDGIMQVQKSLYGIDVLEEALTPDIIGRMQKVCPVQANGDGMETVAWSFANYFLARKVTQMERRELLEVLSEKCRVKLFTPEKTPFLPKVDNMGRIDYYERAPYAMKCAKINLNISLRSIHTGIPLRALDIMGCGGFLITNYQADFNEYFVPNEDYVFYDGKEDLLNLVEYYLEHEEERKKIAENGYRKVKELLSYGGQVDKILGMI